MFVKGGRGGSVDGGLGRPMGAIVAALVAMLLFAYPASAAPVHPRLASQDLDGSSAPAGEFDHPCGTAVDSEGNVYVASAGLSAVDVFSPDHTYLTTIDTASPPCGVAVDSKGVLYVAGEDGNVAQYTPASYPFTGAPSYGPAVVIDASGEAQGIAVDPGDDRLYVAEGDHVSSYQRDGTSGQDAVQEIFIAGAAASGSFTLSFEGQTTGPIEVEPPAAPGERPKPTDQAIREALEGLSTIGAGNVAVEEGRFGVTSHRITFTHALGSSPVGSISADPSGLSGGAVFIEAPTNGFAFDGRIGEGDLGDATAIAAYTYDPGNSEVHPGANARHYLFVFDSNQVKVLSGGGIQSIGLTDTIDGKGVPDSEACPNCSQGFGPGGSLAVDQANGHLFVYDAAHEVLEEFEASGRFLGQTASPSFQAAEPTGVAALPQRGELQELRLLANGGSFALGFEGAWTAPLPHKASPGQVQAALRGLASIGPEGVEVVANDAGSYRVRFTGPLAGRNVGKLLVDPSGLSGAGIGAVNTLDSGFGPGRVYVSAGAGPGGRVLAFGPLAAPSRSLLDAQTPPPLSQALANAAAVATDSAGDVYVAHDTAIQVYSPAGVKLTAIEDAGEPFDLDVDSSGRLYVLDEDDAAHGTEEEVVTYYTPSTYPPTGTTTYSRHEPAIAKHGDFPPGGVKLVAIGLDPGPGPGKDRLFVSDRNTTMELGAAAEGSSILDSDFGASLGLGGRQEVAVNGANGDVYVSTTAGAIFVLEAAGGEVKARIDGVGSPGWKFAGSGGAIGAIAVDRESGHVVAFDNTRGTAEEYDAAGGFVASFGTFTKTIARPYRVAIDNGATSPNHGNAYVAFDDTAPGSFDLTAFGPLAYGEPAVAVTGVASGLGGGNATLNGTVDPRGAELEECEFEYLADEEYEGNVEGGDPPFEGASSEGCAESIPTIGHGVGAVAVHAGIGGLDPNRRYRFRLVAKSKFGADEGEAGLFGPPVLTTEPAQPVLYDEATLRAQVDPSGLASSYRFEYGTAEGEYDHSTVGELAPGDGPVAIEAPLAGLAEGTEYHFRITAENEAGTVSGPDQAFTTQRSREAEQCANVEFRTGASANLPDCRVYELVTPAETNGLAPYVADSGGTGLGFNNWMVVPRGPGAGESLSYFTDGTLPGFDGTGLLRDGYHAQRTAGEGPHPAKGWTTEHTGPTYAQTGGTSGDPQGGASDQRYAFWHVVPQESFEGTLAAGFYLLTPSGFEPVGTGNLDTDPTALSQFVSAGGDHVVFTSRVRLEEGAPAAGTRAIYDRAAGATSAHVVSLLPGDVIPASDSSYAGVTEDGSTVAFGIGGRLYSRTGDSNAVGVADLQPGDTVDCLGGPDAAELAYRWLRNGAPIGGAIGPSYTTVGADAGTMVQCEVVAEGIQGGGLMTSKPLAVAPFPSVAPPRAIDTPTVSGTGEVGEALTCDQGSWEGSPAFAYQWYRDGVPVASATGPTYLLSGADDRTAVQCSVSAASPGGTVLALSARAFVGVPLPSANQKPALLGAPAVGETLTCGKGTWSGSPTFAYQWLRNGAPIAAATADSYVALAADEGKVLQCRVTGSNASGAAIAVSPGTVIPPVPGTAPPSQTKSEGITGKLVVGETLTCGKGTWSGSPTFAYQWLRNGAPIAAAAAATYTLNAADVRTTIACQITASNAGGSEVAIETATVDPPSAAASVPDSNFEFAGISDDGKRLFYANHGALFALDLDTEAVTRIAGSSTFVNVSADGSHVLFISEAVLDEAGEGTPDATNLYAWDASAGIRFVAVLDPQDLASFAGNPELHLGQWTAVVRDGFGSSPARSTPGGQIFAFQSHAQLTAYDNEGHGEIYRYDGAAAPGGRITCVSCDPSGASPSADAMLQVTPAANTTTPVRTRTLIPNLTDDGQRIFFQSRDRLLPEDANNAQDVYEWRAQGAGPCESPGGCLALISSGQGERDSSLYSMSADGHDVFFRTQEKLVGSDVAGSQSIYDARVEGGIPEPAAEGVCRGDACQGQGSTPPALHAPSAGSGGGNVVGGTRHSCPKGKHRVKGRCVKAQRKHHKRANHNRRTHR